MKPFNTRNKIKINDADDFECVCDDMLSEFLQSFTEKEGLIRKPTKDELYDISGDFEITHIYTEKGLDLYHRYIERLLKIGQIHFPEDEFDIKSSSIMDL